MNSSSVQHLIEKYVLEFDHSLFNPTYWPYTIKVETHNMFPAERYCYQHFKTKNWRNRGTKFAFKRKEDYEWFVLRWL